MEVIPDENLVKFYGRTDLDKVDIHISTFKKDNIYIRRQEYKKD